MTTSTSTTLNYAQLFSIAGNAGWQDRIKYAMATAAISVYNELSSTTGHTARVAYATSVINNNYSVAVPALLALTNSTIASEAINTSVPDFGIPDSDLQFTISSIWNALANA